MGSDARLRHYPWLILRELLESLTVLVFTFIAFFMFLWLLNTVLPLGQDLIKGDFAGRQLSFFEQAMRQFLIARGEDVSEIENAASFRAKLTDTWKIVRSKRAGLVTWESAESGIGLFDGDSVQTGVESRAVLEFDAYNMINIGESSLVTISRLEQDPLFSQRQSVVYLNEGEIWGRVRASKSSAGYLEIITPFASARVLNHKNSLKEARFRVNVNADKSTSIVVYDGTAEVVAGDEIIQVPDNHQVIIDRERHVSAPTPLLSAVKPKIPKQQELYYFQELVPLVKFEWDTRDRAEQYRLILARDPLLREVIIDKTIKSNDFRHGNLLTGQYFWQIYATRGSRQGALSELRSLQLIKDNIPPLLKVQGVDAVTSNGAYLIRGTTEAGATVFVNGQAVSVDPKGIFEKTINLNPGYNLIVIEAMDAAKNMSYQTTTVNYQAHR